jgi:uncharacterized protein HemY
MLRAGIIVGLVLVLLTLNAREFKAKRRSLHTQFAAAPTDDPVLALARQQAFQQQTIEQLLHMIHTMLAAILAALLWR